MTENNIKCINRDWCSAYQVISEEDFSCNVMRNCNEFQKDTSNKKTFSEIIGIAIKEFEKETGKSIFKEGFELI